MSEKILYLEKRGCDYMSEDINRDDVGNYRVGSYNYSIHGKNGRDYIIEFTSWDAYRIRYHHKYTGKKLKHPKRELILPNAMYINTEYMEDKENRGYKSSWRDLGLEKWFYSRPPVKYCKDSILEFINTISVDKYDKIEFI